MFKKKSKKAKDEPVYEEEFSVATSKDQKKGRKNRKQQKAEMEAVKDNRKKSPLFDRPFPTQSARPRQEETPEEVEVEEKTSRKDRKLEKQELREQKEMARLKEEQNRRQERHNERHQEPVHEEEQRSFRRTSPVQSPREEQRRFDDRRNGRYDDERYADYQQPQSSRFREQPRYEPPVQEQPQEHAELSSFFEQDKKAAKKLKKKPKPSKVDRSTLSKKERKQRLEMDLYNNVVFKYKNHVYESIDEFIDYVIRHYSKLDKIAKEVFDDEDFFGWIKNYSNQFDTSLIEFKEIDEKIENS